MAYEMRPNTGSLFKNKRKEQPNHPDYAGTVLVGGVEYFLNGWLKQTQAGEKFFSLSLREKNPPAEASRPVQQQVDDSDEIPF